MRRTSVLASLVLLFAIGAAPANARPFTPRLNHFYRLATAYWGGPPPNCTSVTRIVVPNGAIPGVAQATLPSEPMPCTLKVNTYIATTDSPVNACAVIVHEDGHLHGLEHSDDPSNVMYPTMLHPPAICRTNNPNAH